MKTESSLPNPPTNKKVCFVASGGVTINAFLQEPIRRLSEHHQVYVVANLAAGESLSCVSDPDKLMTVHIERKISLWRDAVALLKLIRIFRHHRFDVVHSITPKAGLLAMVAAYLAGVKTRVHTFTGQVWATRTGFSRWLLKSMDCLTAYSATHVLVDSASQRQFLLDEGVISANNSSVLCNGSVSGVDPQHFKPDPAARLKLRMELGIGEKSTVFLFIGRLNRDKGVLDLAAAFASMSTRTPAAHMLVVGPDEDHMQMAMKQHLSTCIGNVHFLGFANNPQDYMAGADVLCLPSYREGFGNVIIEAAAVGIPAIGSRIYGIVDAIAEGESGLLFEARDVQGLVSCMETLNDDRALREKLGAQARARVEKDFSSDKLGSAWMEYYQGLA
ncbi:MAG TPA: glycosyltransferase family 4 protein [Methylophilaceae bacterium]